MASNKRKAESKTSGKSMQPKKVKLNPTTDRIVALSEDQFDERFQYTDDLAVGGFGVTIKATDNRTKMPVIIKTPFTDRVINWTNDIPTEIEILGSLDHDNIVKIEGAFRVGKEFKMVMPNTEGIDLVNYDFPDDPYKRKAEVRYIIHEIAQGLRYLHNECGIVHQDIKLENIIASSDGNHVQIIDFGSAKRFDKGTKRFKVDGGTDLYSCKERYLSTKIIGPEADIFSLGILANVLATGEFPFKELEDIKSRKPVQLELPEEDDKRESLALREFLTNTLVKNPSKRWTIDQVLSSNWIAYGMIRDNVTE